LKKKSKADLEDLDEEDDQELEEKIKQQTTSNQDNQMDVDNQVNEKDDQQQQQQQDWGSNKNVSCQRESVKEIAKLLDSEKLNKVIERIKYYQLSTNKMTNLSQINGAVEQNPEYKLIVEANNLTVEIDNEINVIHKYIRDKYAKRFPELESLVPTALDYIKTVRELGNDVERAKHNERLQSFLTTATIMVLSVSASTTQGTKISEQELAYINEACDISCQLNEIKLKIFEYVESRMTFIAPNLSIIVGASCAAKLMGIAGGLTNLGKMPACNILLLGQQKRNLSGFSSVQVLPHTGFIYYSDICQSVPADLRRQVARIVAAKCTLAARVDSFHESHDGSLGYKFKAEVDMRIEKIQEPPPVKLVSFKHTMSIGFLEC
jgi:U4/U6 small nuclear ribonucleoprotein PRP31